MNDVDNALCLLYSSYYMEFCCDQIFEYCTFFCCCPLNDSNSGIPIGTHSNQSPQSCPVLAMQFPRRASPPSRQGEENEDAQSWEGDLLPLNFFCTKRQRRQPKVQMLLPSLSISLISSDFTLELAKVCYHLTEWLLITWHVLYSSLTIFRFSSCQFFSITVRSTTTYLRG